MNPLATAFMTISTVNTQLNRVLHARRMLLSLDLASFLSISIQENLSNSYQGGMVGLSTAKVMQLAAMKVKIIKSNQSLDVRSLQNCLVLKNEYCASQLQNPPDYELWNKIHGVVTKNEEGIGTPLDKELSHFLKEGLFIVVTNVVIVKIFDKTWKYFL